MFFQKFAFFNDTWPIRIVFIASLPNVPDSKHSLVHWLLN